MIYCSKGVHVATARNTSREALRRSMICLDCVADARRRRGPAVGGGQQVTPRHRVNLRSLRAAYRGATSPSPRGGARQRVLSPQQVEELARSDRWREAGACNWEDPELFFPVGVSGPAKAQEAQALAVCAGCPVLERCREDVLSRNDPFGIQGGMTARERAALVRQDRNHTTKHAHPHNGACKESTSAEAERACTQADVEAALTGEPMTVPKEIRADLVRRLAEAGKHKTFVARVLRLNNRTVTELFEAAKAGAA